MSLHVACYQGRLDVVTQLLAEGANPNEPATERGWISCAGRPKPLNCVAIAWTMTDDHLQIARLLIQHGAIVDDSVLEDHTVEAAGLCGNDSALRQILEAAYQDRWHAQWRWPDSRSE